MQNTSNEELRNAVTLAFGKPQLNNFMLDPEYHNYNHGSFGTTAKYVLAAQQGYVRQQEARPDVWFRSTYKKLMQTTRDKLAKQAGLSSSDNLVLLENASAAVNAIFRSLALNPGDIFIYLSSAYGMVKHTAAWLNVSEGIRILEVAITVPVSSNESFLGPLRAALTALTPEERARVKIATFSHISSVPAFIEPIKELADLVKEICPDALVLVDGAHAIGQIKVDIPALGNNVDYYLSNAHKWLYAPKGSAFLYSATRNIDEVRPQPTVISSENDVFSGTDFQDRFVYTGTKDFTAYISISDALDFGEILEEANGEGSIIAYTNGLAEWASAYLAELWGTSLLSPTQFQAALFNVMLPTSDFDLATQMQSDLLNDHGVYFLSLKDEATGIVYTRLSAQIYLERDDFVKLGELVKDYLAAAKR
eukprot:CAMPEP_0182479306 /NCGR_PEP_ID=MMETSP1319-20130603/33945_1 /TAXON_ID=172717 /ORGANISM="Bolidomonas pacifica, Strain RCC208" /LENGTH=421 /DNA_ID=CAMNT_0024680723 /DNA_START=190 /DNA_END=1455 /DNA_ORIENTATION=-